MALSERMSPLELRASASLASIYGLRMLGMFLILPIFAIYAATLPLGDNRLLVGMALGAYGLTQAIFQLPFGMASDRFGRKQVIYFGLILFAIGSFVAANADSIYGVIVGRAIQGAGAISAAVTALLADLTREEHRTKAMAMVGGTIGITFALSLVAGPALNQWIGVPGIFVMTGVLAVFAMGVIKWVVPNPEHSHFHSDAQASTGRLREVLSNAQLLRLNYGIFALHAAQMAMFIIVPLAIKQTSGLGENMHWKIYLPILLFSFILMIPAIIVGEKQAKLKQVFVAAVGLMLVAQLMFAGTIHHYLGIVVSLGLYFIAFNILEASLPSIISKIAPPAAKGTAMGVYNTCQSLGVFVGGVVGGFLAHYYSVSAVFVFCSVLMLAWLIMAITMQAPPAVKSKMYHLSDAQVVQRDALRTALLAVQGVKEAVIVPEEKVMYLKVDMLKEWDEAAVTALLG